MSVQWIQQQARFNSPLNELNPQMVVGSSGYLYIAYGTDGAISGQINYGSTDIAIMKMATSTGTCQWVWQSRDLNTAFEEQYPHIDVHHATGYVYVSYETRGKVSGQTNTGLSDIVVTKIDPTTGSEVWVTQKSTFNTVSTEEYSGISIDQNTGNIFVSYHTFGTVSGQSRVGDWDIIILKLEPLNGDVLWVRQESVLNSVLSEWPFYHTITMCPSGYIYLTYTTEGTISGQTMTSLVQDIVVAKLETSSGQCLWIQQQPSFNTLGDNMLPSIETDNQGNCYVAYTTNGEVASGQTNTGGYDVVVFKLDATTGQCQWVTQQPTFNTVDDEAYDAVDLVVNSNGQVIVAYDTYGTVSGQTNTGYQDVAIAVFEPTNGTCIYVYQQPTFNGDDYNFNASIDIDTQSYVYLSFITYGVTSGQTNAGGADLAVCKFGPLEFNMVFGTYTGTVPPGISASGDAITYTCIVQNTGVLSTYGYDINIADNLGNSLPLPEFLAGQSQAIYLTYYINQADIDYGYVESQADVTVSIISEILHRETVVALTQISSLSLTKYTTDVGQAVGELIKYVLVLTNTGNVTLTNVRLTDPLLGVDHTILTMPPGFIYMNNYDYVITEEDMERYYVTNTAQAIGADPNEEPVEADVTITTIPCVVEGTLVLMEDGTQRPIQTLQRGDVVFPHHRVAHVCKTRLPPVTEVRLVVLKESCLATGCPQVELHLTENHPVVYQRARRPAGCLTHIEGVVATTMRVSVLYDLQFDHDGTYIANGVEVQSRSPLSLYNPLPEELYFDQSLYSDERVWDAYDQPLPLKITPLYVPLVQEKM